VISSCVIGEGSVVRVSVSDPPVSCRSPCDRIDSTVSVPVEWTTVFAGMQTSSSAPGSLWGLQLAAVPQAVLPPPVGSPVKLIVQVGAAGAAVMPGPIPQMTAPAAASAATLPRTLSPFPCPKSITVLLPDANPGRH